MKKNERKVKRCWEVRTSLNNKLRERRLFAWSSSRFSLTLRLSWLVSLVWRGSLVGCWGSGCGWGALGFPWESSLETLGLVAHPPIGVVSETFCRVCRFDSQKKDCENKEERNVRRNQWQWERKRREEKSMRWLKKLKQFKTIVCSSFSSLSVPLFSYVLFCPHRPTTHPVTKPPKYNNNSKSFSIYSCFSFFQLNKKYSSL